MPGGILAAPGKPECRKRIVSKQDIEQAQKGGNVRGNVCVSPFFVYFCKRTNILLENKTFFVKLPVPG